MNIWDICEEITYKDNWYHKIFDDGIVSKWKEELSNNDQIIGSNDMINLAINLLRASAIGTRISDTCKWEDRKMCDNCLSDLKKKILNNPEDYIASKDLDNFFDFNGWEHEFLVEEEECNHPLCECISPHYSLNNYINYYPEGLLGKELHSECKVIITDMAEHEPIDWHPGSDNKVRDIIHPSMYPYVKGISFHIDNSIAPKCEENIRYQWLPSQFDIKNNAKVQVLSYINNLDENKYPKFIPMIEKVFEKFIPSLENVLHKKICGQSIQVIVKVGSIMLNNINSQYAGGSWHIEGMPHENIAATCIHYIDNNNATDSFLEFRKPVIINELGLDYPQCDMKYTTHHYGIEPESHFDGVMNRYLGLIKCSENSSVIFPNSLQHRVKDFSWVAIKEKSLRTILAFFVIDPDHKIISTKDIPPQQKIFTIEKANYHRERLMFHRKFFVDQLNEEIFQREFSLCEH